MAGLIVLPPALVALGWRSDGGWPVSSPPSSRRPMAAGLLLASGAGDPRERHRRRRQWDLRARGDPVGRLRTLPPAHGRADGRGGRPGRGRGADRPPTRDPAGRAAAAIGWGTLTAVGVAVPLALKYGAGVNYFNLSNNFAVMVVGSLAVIAPAGGGRAWRTFAALYLVLFLPAKAYDDLNSRPREPRPYAECTEIARRLRELLGTGPDGPMFFSQDPRLDCLIPDRAAAQAKLVSAILYRRGVVDYSGFALGPSPTGPSATASRTTTSRLRPGCVVPTGSPAARRLDGDPTRPTFLGARSRGSASSSASARIRSTNRLKAGTAPGSSRDRPAVSVGVGSRRGQRGTARP